ALWLRDRQEAFALAASRPATRPKTVTLGSPCRANPPADSPHAYRPGMTWLLRSMTWHFVLILRPVNVSCRIGVDHAAWNGGFSTLYIEPGFPNSESFPASTNPLYRLTVCSSTLAEMGCR